MVTRTYIVLFAPVLVGLVIVGSAIWQALSPHQSDVQAPPVSLRDMRGDRHSPAKKPGTSEKVAEPKAPSFEKSRVLETVPAGVPSEEFMQPRDEGKETTIMKPKLAARENVADASKSGHSEKRVVRPRRRATAPVRTKIAIVREASDKRLVKRVVLRRHSFRSPIWRVSRSVRHTRVIVRHYRHPPPILRIRILVLRRFRLF